jgi:hypothetical protein
VTIAQWLCENSDELPADSRLCRLVDRELLQKRLDALLKHMDELELIGSLSLYEIFVADAESRKGRVGRAEAAEIFAKGLFHCVGMYSLFGG